MNFFERRRQAEEFKRKAQAKDSKRKIKRHMRNQQERLRQYWELAKRAYRLGDRPLFQKIAKAIAATRVDINRWERQLITFELFEAQRDQAQAGAEFMRGFEAMAKSLLISANPADMARIMQQAQMALTMADQMEDRLEDLMEMTDETLADMDTEQRGELAEIMKAIQSEAEEEVIPADTPRTEGR